MEPGLIEKLWVWAISRIESLPAISPASLLAIVISLLIIAPLWRAAFRNSQHETHVPDQLSRDEGDPISHSESASSLLLYIIGIDRQLQSLDDRIKNVERLMRTNDGGSQLERLHSRMVSLEKLLRTRQARSRNSKG